jgi:hypothetical protein
MKKHPNILFLRNLIKFYYLKIYVLHQMGTLLMHFTSYVIIHKLVNGITIIMVYNDGSIYQSPTLSNSWWVSKPFQGDMKI